MTVPTALSRSLTFADTTIRHLFGISPVQSAQSGLPVFYTDGGAERAGFGVSMVWPMSDHWEATADASAQELLASAGDSPLTERRLQLGLTWASPITSSRSRIRP